MLHSPLSNQVCCCYLWSTTTGLGKHCIPEHFSPALLLFLTLHAFARFEKKCCRDKLCFTLCKIRLPKYALSCFYHMAFITSNPTTTRQCEMCGRKLNTRIFGRGVKCKGFRQICDDDIPEKQAQI